MGISLETLGQISLWEFTAAVRGWNEAHKTGDEPPPPMSDERADAILGLT
jgi:hypothetical protein